MFRCLPGTKTMKKNHGSFVIMTPENIQEKEMQITWKYHTILMTSLQKRFRDELGEAVQRLFGPIHPTIFYVITRNLRKRKLSHLPYMHVEKRKREEIDNKPSSRNQDQPTRILFSEGLSRARKTEVRSRGTT